MFVQNLKEEKFRNLSESSEVPKDDRKTNRDPNIFSGVVYFKKLAMLWDFKIDVEN